MSNDEPIGYFVTEHVLSLAQATTIMRKLKVKKHSDCGWHYILNDLGMKYAGSGKVLQNGVERSADKVLPLDKNGRPLSIFGGYQYRSSVDLYHLRVYRNRPDKV